MRSGFIYNSMFLTKGIEGVRLIFSTSIRSKSLDFLTKLPLYFIFILDESIYCFIFVSKRYTLAYLE